MSELPRAQQCLPSRAILCMAVAILLSAGCANVSLEDCPQRILGDDTLPRLRTSHYRVQLADSGAAARRFLPYALMSAYAYHDGPLCNADPQRNRVSDADAKELTRHLSATTPRESAWSLVPELGLPNGCEDNIGLMFHVWKREVGDQTYVIIAFRGTSGFKDWVYGNLWWITRFFSSDNQISRARNHAGKIINHFREEAVRTGGKPPRFVSTGHSLGGGLAQHLVYAYPGDVEQAIAFNPSSVTGFVDVSYNNRRQGCACKDTLGPEARLIRVYESYEILANLRIFHKLIFPPERHVQEVRFPFQKSWNPISQHGMQIFAAKLYAEVQGNYVAQPDLNWYASKDPVCTSKLIEQQALSCRIVVPEGAHGVCPR
jgi:hypothetical protein